MSYIHRRPHGRSLGILLWLLVGAIYYQIAFPIVVEEDSHGEFLEGEWESR